MTSKSLSSVPKLSNVKSVAVSLAQLGPFIILLIVFLGASVAVPRFLSALNLVNVAYQAAVFIVLAVGMTFVITGGGIDLSIGSQVALIAVVMSGWIHASDWPVGLAIIAAIGFGMAIGAFNGLLIALTGIPDFIITLAGLESFRGLALLHSAGKIWDRFPDSFRSIGLTRVFGLPLPVIIALVIAAIGWFVYFGTFFGRYTIAIGGNRKAAQVCGVPVRRYKALNYVLMGGLCGVAAVLLTSRIDSSQATMAEGYEIHTIASVIMGGTSLFGGRGSVVGSVVGALVLAIIANTMVLLGVNFFWRLVATGIIIVLAVGLNMWRERVLRENI